MVFEGRLWDKPLNCKVDISYKGNKKEFNCPICICEVTKAFGVSCFDTPDSEFEIVAHELALLDSNFLPKDFDGSIEAFDKTFAMLEEVLENVSSDTALTMEHLVTVNSIAKTLYAFGLDLRECVNMIEDGYSFRIHDLESAETRELLLARLIAKIQGIPSNRLSDEDAVKIVMSLVSYSEDGVRGVLDNAVSTATMLEHLLHDEPDDFKKISSLKGTLFLEIVS